jgi:hypothetical protein
MVLNRKSRYIEASYPLYGTVVKIDMGLLHPPPGSFIQIVYAVGIDGKTVILGGYFYTVGFKVLNGMIGPPVAVFKLKSFGTQSQ